MSSPTASFSLAHAGTALDLVTALDAVGADRELLEEIIGLFLHDVPISMRALRAALSREDFGAAVRVAHTLRGTAAQVGAHALAAAALELERVAVDADVPAVPPSVAKLDAAVTELFRELDAKLEPISSAA